MKGLLPLFLGLFGTFAFSWVGLTVIPNYQIGHLDPQADEEDIYPVPKSGMADRGRRVYTGNGCFYCHSQQIRPDYIASDIDRKWGDRRSAPRDYIFERPALIGKSRMGPDLSNIGKRAPVEDQNAPAAGASPAASPAASGAPVANASPAGSPPPSESPAAKPGAVPAKPTPAPAANASPAASPAAGKPASSPASGASPAAAAASPAASPGGATSLDSPAKPPASDLPYSAAWHHKHLYAPRSTTLDSNMPSYRFLYEKRRISGEASADAVKLTGNDAPPEGWEIVPTYEAKCLVAYLMSLDQSHPLKEVKSGGAPASAASPSAAPAAAAAPAPPK
jgi:cbb3-type cytochrome oxidase cytochrome c subunit